MKFKSKKQDDEIFSFVDQAFTQSIQTYENLRSTNLNPHALTSEEVSAIPMERVSTQNSTSALESLKKRMREASLQNPLTDCEVKNDCASEIAVKNNNSSVSTEEPTVSISEIVNETQHGNNIKISNQQEANPEEAPLTLNQFASENKNISDNDTDSSIKKLNSKKTKFNQKKTLLEKCKPFILDDNGKDIAFESAPTYKLESVADILNTQSQKTLDKLAEKYDISFDDLGKHKEMQPQKENFSEDSVFDTVTAEFGKEVFEDSIPADKKVKNIQTNISHVISDIDTLNYESDTQEKVADLSDTATIKFTPVSDSDGSASRISISSQTRPIDLTGELTQLSEKSFDQAEEEIRLEENEFEEYTPEYEYNSADDTKRFIRILAVKKRKSFIATAFSLIFGLLLAFMKLPFMTGIILAHTKVSMIICTALLGIIIILNMDMFKSFSKIFGKRSNADINAALASIFVLCYCIFGIFKKEITLDLEVLLAFILFIRALSHFFRDSYMLSNFRQISVASPKRAIRLIGDTAITFAMAKNAIEGDTLVAAPQRSEHIDDYMKYSTFGTFLGGKLPVITILSIVLSIITALSCASYFDGAVYGFYSAAAMQCFAAIPIVFLIDNLPLYCAAKRLNKVGAMIAGKTGAEHIEMANAVVFSSEELFPSGTVTLHHMKVLADNSVDDTIIRAASLTDCLGSTLSPIFKKIAGTGSVTSLPDSDTVKYEDRMGISGWVDNRLLFIGNRTLMEAHGIEVPSIEVDRKILRKGFFPVYVASDDKAYALLVIQYSVRPEIAHEMRRLSALGVTLLINNSDPNLTEEMVCDYMGLYEDSVKIMSSAGCHMYKNAVTPSKHISAPAAYKGNPVGLASIVNCASKIKKSNTILTVFYIITAVMGAILFAYSSFDGSGSLISSITVLVYGLVCTVVSYILFLMEKP